MQGGSITILNITYTAMAQWFAQKENHKFKAVYESSLIYKNVFFKFINSYLAVFYTAFIKQNYGLGDIFFLMMPVLIVKQFNYILLSVVIPQIVYKHKESQYFK
jgi:anoctamin-8